MPTQLELTAPVKPTSFRGNLIAKVRGLLEKLDLVGTCGGVDGRTDDGRYRYISFHSVGRQVIGEVRVHGKTYILAKWRHGGLKHHHLCATVEELEDVFTKELS